MPRYMLAPFNDAATHSSIQAARDAAEELLEKMGREVGGFIVYEVKEIGRCEYARPIWTEVASLPQRDDEIPF